MFASKGYAGTKILDIVKEAGLSSGAVYGRFESKNALLMEAVVTRALKSASQRSDRERSVADALVASAVARGPLDTTEAIHLEAYVTARREPEVAEAVAEGRRRWRWALKRVVQAAEADGTFAADEDVESILYFLETVHLGLLLQRGAGFEPPDPETWETLIRRIVRSLAEGDTAPS
ncbi:MAG: TetR/AcrR family transcriptional regulator [Proteobacteria bacterium]|nr:TetR/AcrR family transcriptional regulator [Pseudomonadota bacterium]